MSRHKTLIFLFSLFCCCIFCSEKDYVGVVIIFTDTIRFNKVSIKFGAYSFTIIKLVENVKIIRNLEYNDKAR